MKNYTAFLDNWQLDELGSPHGSVSRVLKEYHVEAFDSLYQRARKIIPFYRDYYSGCDIKKVNRIEDIEKLPFVTSKQVVEEGKRFLGVSQDEIKRVVTLNTSGTTGTQKRIFFTDGDIERTINFFTTILSKLLKKEEKGLVLLPYDTPSSAGDLLGIALGKIGVKTLLHGIVKDFNETAEIIAKNEPALIIGLPVQILILSELMKLRGDSTDYIQNIIVTSDCAVEVVKKRIEENFRCSVYDHYGMTETCYGGAIDCFANDGYHLREIDLYFEIIDPTTGKKVKNGTYGEVVITTLTGRGMPLIRYRTGDIASITLEPCICGSPFKRLGYIKHRYINTIEINRISVGMADLDSIIFSEKKVVDYEVGIKKRDGKFYMDIVLRLIRGGDSVLHSVTGRIKKSQQFMEMFEKGDMEISSIVYESFIPENTYISKRQLKINS